MPRLPYVLLILIAATVGCSDSNDDSVTGKGALRALHAVPDLGSVDFLIEETVLGTVGFKGATGISEYDDIEYEFNFDTLLPGDSETTRIASETLTVRREIDYLFVLDGSFDSPEILLWEQPGRDWAEELEEASDNDTEITVMEVSFGHLAPALGEVDVFLEAEGTSPVSAASRAQLTRRQLQPGMELEAGEYQLVVTPAGDPGTILFASEAFEIFAATSNLFVLIDDGGTSTADFSVRWLGPGISSELTDLDQHSELSVYHAAFGSDPVDVVLEDGFAAPLVTDLGFGDESLPAIVDDGTLNLTVTPADNMGVFLAQRQVSIDKGSYNRLFLVGLPGLMQTVFLEDDRRRLATHARLQLVQAAARLLTVDIYVVDEDTDISLIGPTYASFLFGTGTSQQLIEPGGYNIVLTEPGTKTVVAGPLLADLMASRNYLLVITDGANIAAAELALIDKTEP